jgi:hypothetical protein
MHKSQGEGRPRRRGQSFEYFTTTGGQPAKTNLMDGVIIDWSRIKGGEIITAMVNSIIHDYQPGAPENCVPALIKLYQAVKVLPEGGWRNKKLSEVQQLIEECSALYVEATAAQSMVVQGDTLRITLTINKRKQLNAVVKQVSVENFDSTLNAVLPTNQNFVINRSLKIAADKKISQPYWLEYPLEGGTFLVKDQAMIGKPENDPSFEASFIINLEGQDFIIRRPVQYRVIDPVKGDLYEPIPVLPRLELNYMKDNFISLNGAPASAQLHFKSNLNAPGNFIILQKYPKRWKSTDP